MTSGNKELAAEIEFLKRLAETKPLINESPTDDGAAIVVGDNRLEIEVIIEVRLAGSIDDFKGTIEGAAGRLWVYLQNKSDVPLKLRTPGFILTGGLKLPWQVGIEIMGNFYRAEVGEVLSWQVHLPIDHTFELLATDITEIVRKCRMIATPTLDPEKRGT